MGQKLNSKCQISSKLRIVTRFYLDNALVEINSSRAKIMIEEKFFGARNK